VQRRDCDCASVLGDVRRRLRADLEASGAEVSNDPLPVLRADPVLISELFQNLIENAIKYRGEAAPRVHVSAAERPDGWLFAVRDNGVGVPTEQAERIFEPFYQADGSRHLGGGVGLGLATCKRIVERHGGRIHARSAPGEGTTFLFTIDSGPGATAEVTRPEATISPDDPVRPVARAG
jgi:two-component system, chemotaxis family, sensor kinase Cph1